MPWSVSARDGFAVTPVGAVGLESAAALDRRQATSEGRSEVVAMATSTGPKAPKFKRDVTFCFTGNGRMSPAAGAPLATTVRS